MKRLRLAALSVLALAGCVVVPVATDNGPPPPPPPPPPRVVNVPPPPPPHVVEVPPPEPAPVVWYHGPHFIPEEEGGGWCYEEGAHTHSYFPDRPDVYVVDRGYYTYDGPVVFVYVGGHPLPGGGWCFIDGPHRHDYFPPPHAGFVWHHDHHGFTYDGPYRPHRPPPPAFWPHPVRWHRVPPPAQLPARPVPVYRPPRGSPPPPPPRVVPTPPPPARVVPAPPPPRVDDHDRGRVEDRDRRIERGHLDEDPAPPTKPRFEQRFERRKDGEQPKGATTVAPGQKDRIERLPGRPAETVDRRKDEGKADKDKDKSKLDKDDDDAKGVGPVRPGRGRH